MDGYRPGGALRAEIAQHPATAREALLGRMARWIASLVAELTLNRSGSLWTMLEQYGATVEDSLLQVTGEEIVVDVRVNGAPEPGHVFRYGFDEMPREQHPADFRLSGEECALVYRMALSRIADAHTEAVMKDGRICA